MYYITNYAIKLVKLMYYYFLIAADLKQQSFDNYQLDSDEETEFDKSRQFLSKVYNKIVTV